MACSGLMVPPLPSSCLRLYHYLYLIFVRLLSYDSKKTEEEKSSEKEEERKSFNSQLLLLYMAEKGRPLPKFGEWDVNDPASAEGFTVIFNKARNEKKTGGKPDSPTKDESTFKPRSTLGKPQSKRWFCCMS